MFKRFLGHEIHGKLPFWKNYLIVSKTSRKTIKISLL